MVEFLMNMLVSDLQRELSYLRCILYDFVPHLSDKTINKFLKKLERNVKLYSNEKEKRKEKKKKTIVLFLSFRYLVVE